MQYYITENTDFYVFLNNVEKILGTWRLCNDTINT